MMDEIIGCGGDVVGRGYNWYLVILFWIEM